MTCCSWGVVAVTPLQPDKSDQAEQSGEAEQPDLTVVIVLGGRAVLGVHRVETRSEYEAGRREQAAGSPLGAGLVVFGIGFIIAAAFPPTEPEIVVAERATDALEPAKDAALEAVRNVANDIKEGAVDAAQQVKTTAADAAGTVVENAKQQAAATKDEAQQASQR